MTIMNIQLPDETIYRKIFVIRDQKVMLDNDLAELYQVDTKRLNEQVKRNNERFPDDFMFQLTEYEWDNLKSQFATSSLHGGRRTLPYVFTEHGVLMLSSVLNSKRAIAVNIQIMRVYTRLKEMIQSSKELQERMNSLEEQLYEQDAKISRVFQYVQEMNEEMKEEPRTRVGYKSLLVASSKPVASIIIRIPRSTSLSFVSCISTILFPRTRPKRIIIAVESIFNTSFWAVPLFMRVLPVTNSGPTTGVIAISAS